MVNDINLLEELSMNAHPALKTQLYDGWVLRYSNGYSIRANSIISLYVSTIPIKEKIAFCEESYKAQGLPVVFKITPASDPRLDKMLESKGYENAASINMMVKTRADTGRANSNVMILQKINRTWQENYFRLNGILDHQELQTETILQNNIQNKVLCGMLEEDGQIIACGLCVMERNYAGLFDIVVDSSYRGKGHGYDLCASLLNSAINAGTRMAYLQVVAENAPAIALYHKLGFENGYQYFYRVKK